MEIQRKFKPREKGRLLGPGKTFVGRLWRGVARGVIDGIPGVGPSITAVLEATKGEVVQPVARIISSNITIVIMIGLAAERIWGNATWEDVMWILAQILF